jgi:hypothetical protein
VLWHVVGVERGPRPGVDAADYDLVEEELVEQVLVGELDRRLAI